MIIKLLSDTNIRKILEWSIKIATLGFNLPATMAVASGIASLLPNSNLVLTLIVGISGVVVLDAVFLLSWRELEVNKQQDDSDKLADAITVVVMYILTLVIGLIHGEGWAGLIFRVPMGISVARSTWKTFSYSIRRSSNGESKSSKPIQVRWHEFKANAIRGVAEVNASLDNYLADLDSVQKIKSKRREAMTEAGINSVVRLEPLYVEQAIADGKKGISIELPNGTTKKATPNSEEVSADNVVEGSVVTTKSKQPYSLQLLDNKWVATCLIDDCSFTISDEDKRTVTRKIVGHGNKHR